MSTTIYTDGSNAYAKGPGAWAVVIDRDGVKTTACGFDPCTTANRMEMLAAIEGLGLLPPGEPARLVSDSQHLIGGMTKRWNLIQNRSLWQQLFRLNKERTVDWEWARRGCGGPLHDEAHHLAEVELRRGMERLGQVDDPDHWAPRRSIR